MRRSSFWIVACLLASLAIAAGFYVLRGRDGKAAAAGSQVVHPEQRTIRNTVNATGTVRLRVGAEVRIGSQLSGIVKKLNVTVGSHIEQDAIIAEIDSRGLETRIEQARAAIRVDEAELHKADFNRKRSATLVAAGLAPRQQLEDSDLAVDEARVKLAKSQRD